jgi:hypothetical protein
MVRQQLSFTAAMMFLFGAVQVAFAWRTRLLVLPVELLRPVSRYHLQRVLATAFAFVFEIDLVLHLTSLKFLYHWL